MSHMHTFCFYLDLSFVGALYLLRCCISRAVTDRGVCWDGLIGGLFVDDHRHGIGLKGLSEEKHGKSIQVTVTFDTPIELLCRYI